MEVAPRRRTIFFRRLAFIDDLNIVAVRIKHPGRIIARIVFETSSEVIPYLFPPAAKAAL